MNECGYLNSSLYCPRYGTSLHPMHWASMIEHIPRDMIIKVSPNIVIVTCSSVCKGSFAFKLPTSDLQQVVCFVFSIIQCLYRKHLCLVIYHKEHQQTSMLFNRGISPLNIKWYMYILNIKAWRGLNREKN